MRKTARSVSTSRAELILPGGKILQYELVLGGVKNINARVRPDGTVRVSAPRFVPLRQIESFLTDNSAGLLSAAAHAQALSAAVHRYRSGEAFFVLGERVILRVEQGAKNSCRVENGELVLTVRDTENEALCRRTAEEFFRSVCIDAVSEACRRVYPAFSARGIVFPELCFRRMKTKWGVCVPSKGRISFNTCLAHVPQECVEYVAAHEMTHFLQPDHSRRFYEELARVMPDHRTREKRLHSYGDVLRIMTAPVPD